MAAKIGDYVSIQRGFELSHPQFASKVVVYGELDGPIYVNGTIHCRNCDIHVGRFNRIIEQRNSGWVARHEDFRVEPAFQRLGIAWSHYTDCYSFYRKVGISRIEMYAVEFGPFVWPQFGFSFEIESQQQEAWERFCKEFYAEFGKLPDSEDSDKEAFRLVFLEGKDGRSLGSKALRDTAEAQYDGSIKLFVDLNDPGIDSVLSTLGFRPDG